MSKRYSEKSCPSFYGLNDYIVISLMIYLLISIKVRDFCILQIRSGENIQTVKTQKT